MPSERLLESALSPFEVARRLADRSAPLLFFSDGGRRAFIGCDPVEVSHELDPEPALQPGRVEEGHGALPRWFGLVPYEALRGLERGPPDARPEALLSTPIWRRYAAWVEVGAGVRIVGDDEVRVAELERLLRRPAPEPEAAAGVEWLEPPENPAVHAERIRRALELIARGEIYEVNLARRLRFRVEGGPFSLLARLAARPLPAYSAALDWPELSVVAASPELCLAHAAGQRAWTSPIKGTRPRVADPVSDRALMEELDRDPKEVAELTMIVDVERNDLGRLALAGSVRVSSPPHVEAFENVHHRLATVEARLRPEVTRAELLCAMLPSGSVTGAPKVRAMEVIAELEPARRGLYTGAFGVVRSDGSLELAMAIRTLCVRDGVGEYFTGGGIVADSQPEREVEETGWKAAPFTALAGVAPRRGPG